MLDHSFWPAPPFSLLLSVLLCWLRSNVELLICDCRQSILRCVQLIELLVDLLDSACGLRPFDTTRDLSVRKSIVWSMQCVYETAIMEIAAVFTYCD